jgi:hypothetical protein
VPEGSGFATEIAPLLLEIVVPSGMTPPSVEDVAAGKVYAVPLHPETQSTSKLPLLSKLNPFVS